LQGQRLEPGRQRREEHAGAAEERAKREARRKQAAGVQAGQPLTTAEPEHVSGKTGSYALQGNIATHVHTTEAQGVQLDSQCFISTEGHSKPDLLDAWSRSTNRQTDTARPSLAAILSSLLLLYVVMTTATYVP
jgi:hypothetical protein